MFKGTNVKDAMDASTLVMDGFARTHHSTVVISSHLVELAPLFAGNRHIAFCAFEAVMHDGIPVFDYHVRDGVSSQRLGTVVLEREGVSPLLRALSRRDT